MSVGHCGDRFFFEELQTDADVDEDFSFLQPMELITKDVHELQQIVKERKKVVLKDKEKDVDKEREGERVRGREKEKQGREKEREREREKIEKDKEREKHSEDHTVKEMATDNECKHEENGVTGGMESDLYSFSPLPTNLHLPDSPSCSAWLVLID